MQDFKTQEMHSFKSNHFGFSTKGMGLLIIILLPIYLGSALWETAQWNTELAGINLNKLYKFYEDADNSLEMQDVLLKSHEQWQRPPNEKMNFGFDAATLWLKADFMAPETDEYLLEIPYSLLKSMEVIAFVGGEKTYHYKTGIEKGFKSRPVAHQNFLFPFDFQQGDQISLLLKVKSDGFLKLSSRLWHKDIFYQKTQVTNLLQGAYFGTVVIVILYNLLAFIALYNITQFWFIIYGGLFILFQLSMRGFGHQYFWPDSVELQNISICITLIVGGLVSCLFAYSFLELKSSEKSTQYQLFFFAFCMLILLFAYPFVSYSLILRLQIILNVCLAIFFIITGISYWQRGRVETTNFIFAWLLIVLSVLLDGLEKMGVVSNLAELIFLSSDIEILQLISVIEVILLSFALGDKISLERKKGIRAQQELLRMKSEQTQLLEISVDKRTQELQDALKELATVNDKLNSQNNTDSLTGTYNRRFFVQYFEEWTFQHNKNGNPFSLVLIDVDHFKAINDEHGHLFGDQCLITIAKVMKHNLRKNLGDCLCRYGGEEFALLLPETDCAVAQQIAERLRKDVQNQVIEYENIKAWATISAGVATLPINGQKNSKWLFEVCDQALYEAKELGRNRIIVHNDIINKPLNLKE